MPHFKKRYKFYVLLTSTEPSTSPALSHVSTDMSIFSFNIQVFTIDLAAPHHIPLPVQDLSENNTPMLTPVLTPRSSLSRSLLSFSFRSATSARPLSPLVTGTSTTQEERRESPGKKLRSEYYIMQTISLMLCWNKILSPIGLAGVM